MSSAPPSRGPSTLLRRLLGQSAWNLAGFVLPGLTALIAVPFLAGRMDIERFGILSIGWATIGMFSALDLGLGRSLTRWTAELIGKDRKDEIRGAVSTTLLLALIVAIAFGLIFLVVSELLVSTSVAPHIQGEVRLANATLSLGVAFTLYGAVQRGGLEGFSDFRAANLVKIPTGVGIFIVPCLSILFTTNVTAAIAFIVVTRLLGNLAMSGFLKRRIQYGWRFAERALLPELVRHGGWITLSNLVAPLIVFADRFVISAALSAAAVAYFSVAADLVSRILIIPVSLALASFPSLASTMLRPAEARKLIRSATFVVIAITLPFTALAIVLARPFLEIWLGGNFADASTTVFQLLAAGCFANGLAQLPMLALQATGVARQVAIWHSIQLIPYVAGLYLATLHFGIVGTATVWALRMLIDTAVMWILLFKSWKETSEKHTS